MSAVPKTYGDVEGLVTLLLVACETPEINSVMESLLSLPDWRRREFLDILLPSMRDRGADAGLISALVCLKDDALSERVYAEIHACRAKMRA